jgi:pyruvate dehydrogenase E1 component subunit beta
MPKISYRDALNQAMREELARDANVVIFGEDVAEYEGSFKVTRGLLKEFGPERIFDTPIAEAGIIGCAIGMAMTGLRPVPELMTVNFSLVAMDQILNHLAVMPYMFGGQCKLPVTIRMPGGGGHQLGSQHSHSLEALFTHMPGLYTVYPGTVADAKALLVAAIRDDNPVVFLEHEGMYNAEDDVPDDIPPAVIGEAAVRRPGADISLITYGGMVSVTLEAAEQLAAQGISAEVVDLRSLRPWDKDRVAASVAKTHHAIVIEEGPPVCGIGVEVAANITEMIFDELDAPIKRVSGADVPLPYAKELEQSCIPHPEDVVAAAREVLAVQEDPQCKM